MTDPNQTGVSEAAKAAAEAAAAKVKADGGDEAAQAEAAKAAAAAEQEKGTGKKEDQKTIAVTVDVLKAMREENKSLKDQNALYKTQMEAQATLGVGASDPFASSIPQGASTPAKVDGGEVSFDVDDDDVITGADLKKILKSVPGNQPTQVNPEMAKRLVLIELNQQDPNWQSTIQTYLPEMIQSNPVIVNQIRGSANPLQAALLFAQTNPRYKSDKSEKESGDGPGEGDLMTQIDKMIENAEKPGGGAQGGGSPGMSAGDKFTNMSDEEIEAHKQKVMSGLE